MFVTFLINCNNCLSYFCKGKYRFSYLFSPLKAILNLKMKYLIVLII